MIQLALSIDEENSKLRLMSFDKAVIEYKKNFEYAEFPLSLGSGLDETFAPIEQFISRQKLKSVTYVLPDTKVFCDYIEIPPLKSNKIGDILELEVASHFPHGNYKKIFVPTGERDNKKSFFAYLVKAEMVDAVVGALKKYKAFKHITFASAAVANAFLGLRTAAFPEVKTAHRREPILLADIQKDFTRLAVIKDFKLAGFGALPFGEVALTGEESLERFKFMLDETQQLLVDKYGMNGIALKLIASVSFDGLPQSDFINVKNHDIAPHLDLYGALLPKLFKGMTF